MYLYQNKTENISDRNLSYYMSREQLYVRDLVRSALEVIGGPILLPPTAGLSDEVLESSTEDDDFVDYDNYCTMSLFIQNFCEHGKKSDRFFMVHMKNKTSILNNILLCVPSTCCVHTSKDYFDTVSISKKCFLLNMLVLYRVEGIQSYI